MKRMKITLGIEKNFEDLKIGEIFTEKDYMQCAYIKTSPFLYEEKNCNAVALFHTEVEMLTFFQDDEAIVWFESAELVLK